MHITDYTLIFIIQLKRITATNAAKPLRA